MLKEMAEKVVVDEAILIKQLHQLKSKTKSTGDQSLSRNAPSFENVAEDGLVLLLLEDEKKWARSIFQFISPKDLRGRASSAVLSEFYNDFLQGQITEPDELINRFQRDLDVIQFITKLMSEGMGKNMDRSQFGLDCVLRVKRSRIYEKIQTIQEKIKLAQNEGKDLTEYSKIWVELRKELKNTQSEIENGWKKNVEI